MAFLMGAGAFVGEQLYAMGWYPIGNPRIQDWKAKESELLWRPILVIACSLIGLASPYLVKAGMPTVRVAGRLWLLAHHRSQTLRMSEIVLFGAVATAFAAWWLRSMNTPSAVP